MVAVITKSFGLQYIEIAEDIVAETFLLATETWAMKGMPSTPVSWLYMVARQKTLAQLNRNKVFNEKVIPQLTSTADFHEEIAILNFSKQNIKDSQLQMLFAVCNTAVAAEAQIGLALRILCGFGIDEIAEAFLSNKETINKRLYRAKEKLRIEKIQLELPNETEIVQRLDNVLRIIYLVFNEGYYSKTQSEILRQDLCLEAMRLAIMLTEFPGSNLPKTKALMALMCFHASRFGARQTEEHAFILYEQQNEQLWDHSLIKRGSEYLAASAEGSEISSYHLEAKIAYWHCIKEDSKEKWEDILQLYDQLIQVNYSPSAALNRTYALYQVQGWEIALGEAKKLKLEENHFYFLLLAELSRNMDKDEAITYFQKAHAIAKTSNEKIGIQRQIEQLSVNMTSINR